MYKRIGLSIIIILLMGVSFFGGIQYSELKAKEQATNEESRLEKEVASLYNDNQTDLKEDVTQEKLSDLNMRFEAEENKTETSAKLLLDANYMLEFYTALNVKPGSDLTQLNLPLTEDKIEELSLILEQIENKSFVKEKEASLLNDDQTDNVEEQDEISETEDEVSESFITNKGFKTAAEAVKWAQENMSEGENWSKKGFTSWKTKPIAEKDEQGKTTSKVYEIEFKKEN